MVEARVTWLSCLHARPTRQLMSAAKYPREERARRWSLVHSDCTLYSRDNARRRRLFCDRKKSRQLFGERYALYAVTKRYRCRSVARHALGCIYTIVEGSKKRTDVFINEVTVLRRAKIAF